MAKIECLLVLAGLSFSTSAHADTNCDAEQLGLQQLEIIALAENMSNCETEQAAVRLSQGYAAYFRRCLPGTAGETEALRYDKAAAASQNAANASCDH